MGTWWNQAALASAFRCTLLRGSSIVKEFPCRHPSSPPAPHALFTPPSVNLWISINRRCWLINAFCSPVTIEWVLTDLQMAFSPKCPRPGPLSMNEHSYRNKSLLLFFFVVQVFSGMRDIALIYTFYSSTSTNNPDVRVWCLWLRIVAGKDEDAKLLIGNWEDQTDLLPDIYHDLNVCCWKMLSSNIFSLGKTNVRSTAVDPLMKLTVF